MREAFEITIVDKLNEPTLFASATSDGILFQNETDSTHRGFVFQFVGRNRVTEYRMKRVRILNGWQSSEFKLAVNISKGRLRFTGVRPDALPSGSYRMSLWIESMEIQNPKYNFDIPENDSAAVSVSAQDDKRQISLTVPPSGFDPSFQKILQSNNSDIDGMHAEDWLTHESFRAVRKACLLNILAKLRVTPLPKEPLIDLVQSIFTVGPERIYVRVDKALLPRLHQLADNPKKPFYYEGAPNSPTHQKLVQRLIQKGIDTTGYVLESFRAEGKPSLQCVIAHPQTANSLGQHFADIDIDLGNPLQDLQGFVIHVGELLDSGITDHIELGKKLAKSPAGTYLYYTAT